MEEESKDLRALIEGLRANGNAFCEFLIGTFLKLDGKEKSLKYSEEELEMIEEKIDEMFPEGHKPKTTTLIPFGFYLGEVLKRKIPGAEWHVSDEANKSGDLFEIVIEFDNADGYKMQAKPFIRVNKYWKKREDRMSSYVKLIEMNTEVQMDPEYWSKRTNEDGWISMANEMMFRMFVGDGETQSINDPNLKGAFHDGKLGDGKY